MIDGETQFTPDQVPGVPDRYEVLVELGRGGMGIVYKARDRQTGAVVAVKVLNPLIVRDVAFINRFKNELLLARKVTHKNVCRMYDLNEFGETAVLSMEYVSGESLRTRLRKVESLSNRQGLMLLRQIISGLAEAHAQGVVHRDLKPENILITADGTVKILDFGIARIFNADDTAVTISGTPAYMSPEHGSGRADARSDIYALGVLMYEMFLGRQPFSADSAVALLARHQHDTPTPPREIDPDLPIRIDRAILKCLEKDPASRFQSLAELETMLFETPADPPSLPEPVDVPLPLSLSHWQRTDWLIVAGAAIGLLLYFPFFARTNLAPRSQVTFERSAFNRIVAEHLRELGVSPQGAPDTTVYYFSGRYEYVATQAGATFARDLAGNPVPYWEWNAYYDVDEISIYVDADGALLTFFRPGSVESIAPPFSDSKIQAEQAVQQFFKQPVTDLDVERSGTDGRTNTFSWTSRRGLSGLVERYSVSIDAKGIQSLNHAFNIPTGYRFSDVRLRNWGVPVAIAVGFIVSLLGFLQRARVAVTARWRMVLLVIMGLAGAVTGWVFTGNGLGFRLLGVASGGSLAAGAWILCSIAAECQIRRRHPEKLTTLTLLLGHRPASEAPALAAVRGTCIGLALLGVEMCAIWAGTTHLGAHLDILHLFTQDILLNESVPLVVFMWITMQVVGLGLLVAIVASTVRNLVARAWLSDLIAGGLLAIGCVHLSMGAIQPIGWTIALLLMDFIVLVWVFRRFDLLTLFITIFTFAFWSVLYPHLVMMQRVGNTGSKLAFAVWALSVVAALALVFQSQLKTAYARLT